MMSADGRRMLLRQGTRDVLLARIDQNYHGVHLFRLPGWTSPVPPIPFGQARRLGADPVRWAHWFASALTEPLHDGEWVLVTRDLPAYVLGDDLVRDHPTSYVDWFGAGWDGAVPLRPLSDVDAARVKAYRKLATEGVLPPVLLWGQSGLAGYLVLDGHDRLVAARAAGVTPPVLVLDRAADARWLPGATADHENALRHVDAEVARGQPGAEQAREALVRRFARLAASIPEEGGRTMAWPLSGGAEEWDRIAAAAGFVT
jgi:hypothetical protein